MKINWNGTLETRRYAMFNSLLYGNYMIVIKGNDINTAEKWGGFVQWIGGGRKEETRGIKQSK